MAKTLVIGIGNLLLSDEGVGVHAVRRLEQIANLPPEVQVIDGGTMGLHLLYLLEGVSRLILIDAVASGRPPGTLIRLSDGQIPTYLSLKLSPHEIGIPDLLMAAKLRDLYPKQVVVWGVEPARLDMGVELSPVVAGQLDNLVHELLGELSLNTS